MFKRIVIIVNPVSGGVKNKVKIAESVSEFFSDSGSRCELEVTSGRGEATVFAKNAVSESCDLVIAIGGDGTINEVASSLVNTETTLGIIPVGSGNGFARSLKIPSKVDAACRLISENRVYSIDVGKANERYFFLVAGVGFDAAVGKSFDDFNHGGLLSYIYIGFREFWRFKPEKIRISFGNTCREFSPFIAAIANGQQYGNEAVIAPDAKLNDGLFDICIFPPFTAIQFLRAASKIFNGKADQVPGSEFYKSNEVVIERDAPGYVNIDGEPVMEDATVKITILPKSLKVIASSQSTALLQGM